MSDLSLATKAVLITSRIFASASVLASICTALEAIGDWHLAGKKSSIITRIQIVLQLPLALHATCYVFGSSLVSDGWLSFGNDATCSAQGFAILFAISCGIPFDMVLSLIYLCMVKYGWNETSLRKIEPYSHALIWPYALGISIYSLLNNLYGDGQQVCFVSNPEDCAGSSEGDCTPTPDILITIRLVVLGVNMAHLLVSVFVMCQVYGYATRGQEEQVTRLVAIKGFLYAFAVSTAQVPTALWLIVYMTTGYESKGIEVMYMLVLPLIGFLNLLVFMMNRRTMHTAYGRLWRRSIDWTATAFCCCFHGREESR